MKRAALRATKSKDLDLEFRRLSPADDLGRKWCYALPQSVPLNMLALYGRTLDPQVIEQTSRVVLEKLCEHKGKRAFVDITNRLSHKKQVKGFIVYTDGLCDQALEILSHSRAKQNKVVVYTREVAPSAQPVLRDLEAMLKEQDEPDFRHSPTKYAYDAAHATIENAYTHYLRFAPTPAIAPDGDGGIIVEWKSGQREVRLILAHSEDHKSYIYSRDEKSAIIDYELSGLILAQRLNSVFAD